MQFINLDGCIFFLKEERNEKKEIILAKIEEFFLFIFTFTFTNLFRICEYSYSFFLVCNYILIIYYKYN